MKHTHDRILQEVLPLKLNEIMNALTFVSSFLNIIQLGVLNFLFTTQAYVQGGEWNKLILIDWNEYQENTNKHRLSVS